MLEIVSFSDSENWNYYLNNFLNISRDIYFEKKYLKLFEYNNEGDICCFVYKEEKSIALYPVLKNNINKLGYELGEDYFDIQSAYGYSGVLTNNYDKLFMENFFKKFKDYCSENHIIAEFVRFHPILKNHLFSNNNINVIFDRETVVLNLNKSYDDIWLNQYTSKNRNMIRKAQNLKYTSKVISNPTDIEVKQFIEIYKYSMKTVNADEYYYFSDDFFYKTFQLLINNVLLISVLNADNDVVCSSIFFHNKDYFHYHLSGRTSLADNSVNNFLLDEAIKFAKTTSAKYFHFGGGRSSDKEDSLLKFKSNFSKQKIKFYIGKQIHNIPIYNEIVRQWEAKNPDKIAKYNNHLLKYRY